MLAAYTIPHAYLMPVLGYLLLVNALALAIFGLNRASSEDGDWGSAEMRVLLLAILGGWIGAKLGRMMYPADEEPRSFGMLLNLAVLAIPAVLAAPYVLHRAPDWISAGYGAYVAQYAENLDEAEKAKISPVGASHTATEDSAPDSTGIVAALDDSPAPAIAEQVGKIGDAVSSAANTEVNAPVLPKRFGPGSGKPGKKGGIKFLSVGGG